MRLSKGSGLVVSRQPIDGKDTIILDDLTAIIIDSIQGKKVRVRIQDLTPHFRTKVRRGEIPKESKK